MAAATILVLALLAIVAITTVQAGAGGPRPGLCVGTSHGQGGCDVVKNGTVSPDWSHEIYDFEPGEIAFTLFYSLNRSELAGSSGTQPYKMVPQVYPKPVNLVVVFPPPGTDSGNVTVGKWTSASHIEMMCTGNGTARVHLEILVEPYEMMTVLFNKTCVVNNINVGVPYTRGLPNVVQRGKVTIGFRYTADVDEASTMFGVWVDNQGGITRQHFTASVGYDPRFMNVADQISPSPAIATTVSAGPVASINLIYNCLPSAYRVESKLNLSIDVGWVDPIFFSWTKVCGPPTTQPEPGMGAVAVFFLTTFIAITVFCTAGCVWNYVKNNRTGVEMIPGIDVFRQCRRKICGGKSYSPQSNYDDEADTAGATTYQTDL